MKIYLLTLVNSHRDPQRYLIGAKTKKQSEQILIQDLLGLDYRPRIYIPKKLN